jgi:hypothetical protein
MKNYIKARLELYEHVGFEPDWVECPIDDCTEMFWGTRGTEEVCYAENKHDVFNGDGFCDEIYTQRHYPKHIYEGTDLTLVFCDPHVDGCKWFRVFDNSKRVPESAP